MNKYSFRKTEYFTHLNHFNSYLIIIGLLSAIHVCVFDHVCILNLLFYGVLHAY